MTIYEKTKTDVVPIVPLPDFGTGRPCLIVMRGTTTGAIHWITDGAVLGREEGVSILIPVEEVSRRQCRFEIRDNDEVWIEDIASSNDTLVDGQRISRSTRLEEGAMIQLGFGAVVKFIYHDELEAAFQSRMYDAALRDPLTGLFNRRYLDEYLEAEFAFASRHKAALTVCMIDLDHFKQVNDIHGHEAGDLVLAEVGKRISETVRTEDTCCRYGGEEFVILSLGISLDGGLVLAERLRGAVQDHEFRFDGGTVPVTVSVGVAGFPYPSIDSPQSLLSSADQALYLAKQRGRNRCKVFITQ